MVIEDLLPIYKKMALEIFESSGKRMTGKYLRNRYHMSDTHPELNDYFDLSRIDLKEIPFHLIEKIDPISLGLFRNKIDFIPKFQYKGKKLRRLGLSENQISDVRNLKVFAYLESLNLSKNKFDGNIIIPDFKDLKILYLDNNDLNDFQELVHLEKLEQLILYSNKIGSIPENFNLPNLKWLDLGSNLVAEIPKVISEHPSLKRISLDRNHLKKVGNVFDDIPNLEYIDLTGNKISNYPNRIGDLEKWVWNWDPEFQVYEPSKDNIDWSYPIRWGDSSGDYKRYNYFDKSTRNQVVIKKIVRYSKSSPYNFSKVEV